MLHAFQWFVMVVEAGSMNQAALKLRTAQPALSRNLKQLEKELGVTLFDRSGKRLVLTRAGQLTYDHARKMLQRQKEFLQQLSSFHSPQRGRISIGASLTTLQTTLPDLITRFRTDHPEIDIHAVTGKTHEIVTQVREKKVDLGLVAARVDQPDIVCVPLFEDHLLLVLPGGHPHAAKPFESIHELDGLPMILFSSGTWYRVMMDNLFDQYRIRPDVHLEIDSFEAIVRLVSTCGVATLLPESYVKLHLRVNPDLRVVSVPELQKVTRTTSMIFTEPHHLSAATHQFVEHVRASFSSFN